MDQNKEYFSSQKDFAFAINCRESLLVLVNIQMANTVNGGSHSSNESLNGKFRKRTKRTRTQSTLRQNNIRNTNGGRLVVIKTNTFFILSQVRG